MKKFTEVVFYLCCIAFLASCANKQKIKPEATLHLFDLTTKTSFQFTGKMSFSDGQEGGSGQVSWQLHQGETKLVLKAPLSKKSWELFEYPDGAQLTLSDGEMLNGMSAKSLISEQLGWEVPWHALKLWVIGQKTSGGKILKVNEGMGFIDQGWEISYSQFKSFNDRVLPHKITARKDSFSIKLIIKQWQW